jgi:hypothetical protein
VKQLEQEVEKLVALVNGGYAPAGVDCSPELSALLLENTKLKHRLSILKKVCVVF